MLIGASTFLSQLDMLHTVAIAGPKRSGKDLLAFELSRYYLEQGYKFTTNQLSVWNDPYYHKRYFSEDERQKFLSKYRYDSEKGLYENVLVSNQVLRDWFNIGMEDYYERHYLTREEYRELTTSYGVDEKGFYELVPDIKKRVIVLTEGGKYLREWKYFQDLYEFTGKMKVFLFIPSIRLPHENITEMTVVNAFPLSMLGLGPGGLFRWEVSGQGLKEPIGGLFFFKPEGLGLYDTEDYSVAPTEIISWFTKQIDYDQKHIYGRDGIRSMEVAQESIEVDALSQLARQNRQTALSLSHFNKKR